MHSHQKWLYLFVVSSLLILVTACSDKPELRPLPPGATILALGDSLTYGTGVDKSNSYPTVLQTMTGVSVINAGIPGETSADVLRRLEHELDAHQPDLVVLCVGGNDILQRKNPHTIERNIQQIIDTIKQQNRQLVLLAVPEFGLFPTAPDYYQQLADKNDVPLDNDTIPAVLRNPKLKSDPIHGNEAGYQKIARSVFELLRNAGAINN